jgi:hypothetical protein
MTNPERRHPQQRTGPGTRGRCSAQASVTSHRMAIPPPPVGLGQLQLLAPRLRPPPQRRLRITRHRIHLSPRENRTILRQHRKLNRRILAFTEHPAQRPPHPMRPPPGALNDWQWPDTEPLSMPVRLGWTPSGHTQSQPRLQTRHLPRHRTLSLGDRRRVCSAHQPTHRGALPPGLHTTRDLRQPERHRAISNNLTQRRHHPRRSSLRPYLPCHTPEYAQPPRQPAPQTPDSRQTAGTFVPPDHPTPTGPQGPEPPAAGALPRTPAPLRRPGGTVTRLVVSSRRGQALPDGGPLRARDTPPLHSGPTARQPHRGAARRQPPTCTVELVFHQQQTANHAHHSLQLTRNSPPRHGRGDDPLSSS